MELLRTPCLGNSDCKIMVRHAVPTWTSRCYSSQCNMLCRHAGYIYMNVWFRRIQCIYVHFLIADFSLLTRVETIWVPTIMRRTPLCHAGPLTTNPEMTRRTTSSETEATRQGVPGTARMMSGIWMGLETFTCTVHEDTGTHTDLDSGLGTEVSNTFT